MPRPWAPELSPALGWTLNPSWTARSETQAVLVKGREWTRDESSVDVHACPSFENSCHDDMGTTLVTQPIPVGVAHTLSALSGTGHGLFSSENQVPGGPWLHLCAPVYKATIHLSNDQVLQATHLLLLCDWPPNKSGLMSRSPGV